LKMVILFLKLKKVMFLLISLHLNGLRLIARKQSFIGLLKIL